ncbi:LysR family transcriptional regulator [Herbaspirillum sp.]|uniref:LysR family transcriptional regulator n=1 Tax=Herbaspirillum sp. TaxID=1890675 RepID=UPI001B0BEA88|nr:LysR family transcriptional regulator [Herbaspirillum sp.]MBO9536312.1 LysR family transcriptional regulator [Herbaspirillum sp.]
MAFSSDNVKIFLAVLDGGSFSAAARMLGRVPSAVSMAISQLEAELDLVLFDRTARDARPTDMARALEPDARLLASTLRQLDAHALAMHQGLERKLTLAVAPELLSVPWAKPLAVLAEEFPSLEVEVLSTPQADAMRMLYEDCAQLAVVFERHAGNDREAFQEFSSEMLVAVISPQHPALKAKKRKLRYEDLYDIRQIAVASRDASVSDPRFFLARQIWRTDNHLATLSLVREGLGWAYLPHSLVQAQIDSGALAAIDFDNISNQLRLWVDVVWNKDKPLGLGAQRFIALMREMAPSRRKGK